MSLLAALRRSGLLVPTALIGAAALLASAVSGCGAQGKESGPDQDRAAPAFREPPATVRIPVSEADLGADPAWYSRGTLHVGDRRQRLPGVLDFAVATHTVAYVERSGRLCFSNLARTSCTAYRPATLVVSPDGSRLGFLHRDRSTMARPASDLLSTTVLDLASGKRLTGSTAGMGDPDTADLSNLYESASPTFRGFTETGDAVVDDAENHTRVFPADGGPGRVVSGGDKPRLAVRHVAGRVVKLHRETGTVRVLPATAHSIDVGRRSPDGGFLVTGTAQAPNNLRGATAPSGRVFSFTGHRDPWWTFGVWSGPHRFLATTTNERQNRLSLYRCDLSTRACTRIEGFPIRTGHVDAVRFPTAVGTDAEALVGR